MQTPPWSDGTDGKDYVYLTTPEDLYFPNKPEIYNTLIGEGVQKQLWFKAQGLEWDSVNVVMPQYTNAMKRLVKVQNSDALLISGDAYSGVALHDTNTHVQIYGSDPTASIATLESVGDKVYIAGYPNAMLHVLDTTKPFLGRVDFNNFHPDTISAERTDDEMNPRLLSNLYAQGGCKTLYASSLAADGKVYFTGKWRDNGSGGCLSWIDTNDESTDGISEIFSNYRGRDITTTGDGRYLVISTTGVKDVNDPSKPEPEVGRLFIYDTQGDKTQVMKTIEPLENAVTAGYIVGSGGNTITGIANDAGDAERVISYIYKVDVVTGEMIFKKQMDKGVSFVAYDDHKTHEIIKYCRGNVYFIAGWTWRDKVFVKVEADGSLTSIASLPLGNDFGDFECVGNDLYGLSGEVLKKVENVFN